MRSIPVTVLTGFLGSGKTTLLSAALGRPEFADSAVIVNEFGEVSIDHLMVADLAENIIELRDGCLCCTIRGDLVMTLRELYRKRCLDEVPKFARVIVETTGLADPVPLIHTLMANPSLMKVFALDAVVCTVDGIHGARTLDEHSTAHSQVAFADVLVVTKTDCADADGLAALLARLKQINASAEVVLSANGDVAPGRLLERGLFQPAASGRDVGQWLTSSAAAQAASHDHEHEHDHDDHHDHAHVHDHGEEYGSFVIRHAGPLSLAGTSVFLNRVVNEFKDEILRIKGLAGFRERGGQAAILHAVQNKFYPILWLEHWPDADPDSRFVFIGRALDTARINELFESLCV